MNASTAPSSLLLRSTVALAALVTTSSCGEPTESEPDPVPDGKGEYQLTIETLTDDCEPRLVSGDLGRAIVLVRTDGKHRLADVPVYHQESAVGPQRWEVFLNDSFVFDRRIVVEPPCAAAYERDFVTAFRADSSRIDVDWTWSVRGIETCEGGGLVWATRDCSSQRIYRFRLTRACEPDRDVETCL